MNWELWVARAIEGFNAFVLAYFLALNISYIALFFISLREVLTFLRRTFFSDYQQILRSDMTLPISMICPAHNEEKTIVDTVRSLQMLNYPEFEIIVVNDGSKDQTLERLLQAYDLRRVDRVYKRSLPTKSVRALYASPMVPNLIVVDKENGGKADALNCGINLSRYPLFSSMDADSVIEDDALLKAVKPFMEWPDETVAVGGIVRCANGCTVHEGRVTHIALPRQLLPVFQVVEYLRAFLSGRLGWSALRWLLLISGAFGVYRKSAVVDVGGYDSSTDTEDLELVMALHAVYRERKKPYRIVFVPDPVCWTEVPGNWKMLRRQRNRWHRGMLQSLSRYRRMMFNPRYGLMGMVVLPYFLIFETMGPFIETLGYISVPLAWALGLLNTKFFLLFFVLAVAFGVFLSVAAILLEEISYRRYPSWSDLWKLLFCGVAENFGFRQVLAVFKIQAFWEYLRGLRRWGKLERVGFVKAADTTRVA
ncbi:MAG TPA: glycosyltransferase family 2 protein [Gemmatimonadales bacterium]|nr:glycosyltransferase family 2 protein [Gemmatimonadales bacterium]